MVAKFEIVAEGKNLVTGRDRFLGTRFPRTC